MHRYVENGKRYLPNMMAQFAFCGKLATEIEQLSLLEKIAHDFATAEPDERDYAIASAYSLLIGEKKRQQLSAYFTPPVLSQAVMEASAHILGRFDHPIVLDPACGGGSFITPIVRHLVSKSIERGCSVENACKAHSRACMELRSMQVSRRCRTHCFAKCWLANTGSRLEGG